jgi:hypothetical protein
MNSRVNFSEKKALELANALADNIFSKGFNALSKTDFYDFVLYLLDVYSEERFLSANSNERAALLLKVTPAKVKASRLNIFLKFAKPEERQKVLADFIRQIGNKKIRVDYDDDPTTVRFTVDDPTVRLCLDEAMKDQLGTSADTSFNGERLVMKTDDFYAVYRYIVETASQLPVKDRESLLKELDRRKSKDTKKAWLDFILEASAEIAQSIIPGFPAETTKKAAKQLFNK